MKKIILASLSLLYMNTSFAVFCPGNFNQINNGDTIEQVEAQCGKETSQATHDEEPPVPQEWIFYVPLSQLTPTTSMPPANAATSRLTVALDNNKVTNITNNGIGLPSFQYCTKGLISVGDTAAHVKDMCGSPAMINKSSASGSDNTPKTKVTVLTYVTDSGTTTLTFVNGMLKTK